MRKKCSPTSISICIYSLAFWTMYSVLTTETVNGLTCLYFRQPLHSHAKSLSLPSTQEHSSGNYPIFTLVLSIFPMILNQTHDPCYSLDLICWSVVLHLLVQLRVGDESWLEEINHWRRTLEGYHGLIPSPISFIFPVSIMWAAFLSHMLPTMMFSLTRGPKWWGWGTINWNAWSERKPRWWVA
jgi:hypothetical protein